MPRAMLVDPTTVRRPGTISTAEIPINQFQVDPVTAVTTYGIEGLLRAHADMVLIREFELMLDQFKTKSSYEGIAYTHAGPAHLSIGQEATAVGQCLALAVDDLVFGSHRSHGEILAKCLTAIHHLPEADLLSAMRTYAGGQLLAVVEPGSSGDVRDLALDFVLYGVLAEIFGRATGFNKGLGGSMHAFFAPFGSMPNNAIVGGSADIATGAALFKRVNRRPGIVVANIGDAAAACGPTWEAMQFAAMAQYRTLWDADLGGAPPILFFFINNFYGMGGQTHGETMGFDLLARIGAGVNREALHAERVDGYQVLAVADAVARKKRLLEEGLGPVLLDVVTYRVAGHSSSDASSYRSTEEIELWERQDCIVAFAQFISALPSAPTGDWAAVPRERAVAFIRRAAERATSAEVSPRLPAGPAGVEAYMFSGQTRQRLSAAAVELAATDEPNPRQQSIQRRHRFALQADGTPHPKTQLFTVRDALFEALLAGFQRDPTMIAYGEENRDWGGAFAVYRGLTEALPYHRLFNAPIAEAAIVGSAVGYALCGGRVVVELMYCDFLGRAGDEIFNQLAKWQAMSAGELQMPVVLRVSVGNKYGAQHSQDWSSLVSHIPGLKVMFPVTPYDAKGMLHTALVGTDPVIFFESQRLYDMGELFETGGVPEETYEISQGQPVIRRTGTDLTIVTVGATLYRALAAADQLQERYGVSTEVIDLRFLNPLDYDLLVASAVKTGRVLLSSDACERGSFLQTVAATLSQLAFDHLDAPVVVIGARNWITPPAEMEEQFFPQPDWLIDAVHERLLPLADHVATTNQTLMDLQRRDRAGV